jgi:Uma2 family endonuclease
MADNTVQYRWIVRLVDNLKQLLSEQTAFVAGDLLWYPMEIQQGTPPAQAPDVMVALGRPDRDRGSYKQWQEENIAPQVVFEIISPSHSVAEMATKQNFYAQHGVLEMYFYDPASYNFWGLVRERQENDWTLVMPLNLPWVSPLLQIRFELFEEGLAVFYPDGEPFKDFVELRAERDQAQQERDRAIRGEQEKQAKLDQALAKLRELGIDPESL